MENAELAKYDNIIRQVNEGNFESFLSALEKEPDYIHSAQDWHGDRLLALACWASHYEIVKKLIEMGSDINAVNESNSTALHRASFKGDSKTVELLIDNGADYNMRDRVVTLH